MHATWHALLKPTCLSIRRRWGGGYEGNLGLQQPWEVTESWLSCAAGVLQCCYTQDIIEEAAHMYVDLPGHHFVTT